MSLRAVQHKDKYAGKWADKYALCAWDGTGGAGDVKRKGGRGNSINPVNDDPFYTRPKTPLAHGSLPSRV